MKTERLILGLVAIVVASGCSRLRLASPTATPHRLVSTELISAPPDPPEPRAAAWTPPKNDLPADFVEAVKFLQSHGMGDPRGGEFVQAYVPGLLNRNQVFLSPPLVAGWIAKQADGKVRFVTEEGIALGTWSGERSPILASYIALDPSKRSGFIDTRHLATNDSVLLDRNVSGMQSDSRGIEMLPGWDVLPKRELPQESRTPEPEMLAALLLVDGRPDDAKKVLKDVVSSKRPILLSLATDLLKSKWTRALETYARGEDRAAFALVSDVEDIRSACNARLGRPSFPFLRQAPDLLRDLRRRLSEPEPLPLTAGSSIEQQIVALEGCGLAQDPATRRDVLRDRDTSAVVENLAKAGDRAIEPLIRAAGSDSRLTREILTVDDAPYVVPVREVALRILNACTGASFHCDREGRLPTEDKLVAWWSRNASLNLGEREFRFLADDGGDELQWVFAAKNIAGLSLTDSNVSVVEQRWSELRLTDHKSPSVSQLMIRRMNQMLGGSSWQGAVAGAEVMEQCLEQWDRASARAAASVFSERLFRVERERDAAHELPHLTATGDLYSGADPCLLGLLEQRIASGDESGLPEYKELLVQVASSWIGSQPGFYKFLYVHRDDPAIAEVTKQIFFDPVAGAPPNKVAVPRMPLVANIAYSPLINLRCVQDAIVLLLKNRTAYWTYVRKGDIMVGKSINGTTTALPLVRGGPETYTLRLCDQVAQALLSQSTNSLSPEWPVKQKNAIVNSLIQALRRHPKHYWPKGRFDTFPPVSIGEPIVGGALGGGIPGAGLGPRLGVSSSVPLPAAVR